MREFASVNFVSWVRNTMKGQSEDTGISLGWSDWEVYTDDSEFQKVEI